MTCERFQLLYIFAPQNNTTTTNRVFLRLVNQYGYIGAKQNRLPNISTVKLCYSESGRPRHIFSLLPSSRYSQMTNLPRETKGNNLGTGAVDLRGLQCDGGCVTLGLCAGRERQRHRAHSSQTKMRGGGGGRGRGDYTPHKDTPFVVTGHHEMCPTGNLTTRWGWGEWRELL